MRYLIKYIAVFCAVIFIAQISTTAHALDKQTAEAYVNDVAGEVSSLVRDESLSNEAYLQKIRALFRQHLDLPVIAQFLLGTHGRGLDKAVYGEFTEALEDYVVLVYGLRMRTYYDGERLEISHVSERNKSFLVHTKLISPKSNEPFIIGWRLYSDKSGAIKVIDIIISDISMIISQRDEFAAIIRNNDNDVGALVQEMQAQTDKVRQEFLQGD